MDRNRDPMVVHEQEKKMKINIDKEKSKEEQAVAKKYFHHLVARMGSCGGQTCDHSQRELENVLSYTESWMNLSSYKQVTSSRKIGVVILNKLRPFRMPLDRTKRREHIFDLYGLNVCYYCILAWLGIPEGTARKYMFVHPHVVSCESEVCLQELFGGFNF